jgi:hypothetical protein
VTEPNNIELPPIAQPWATNIAPTVWAVQLTDDADWEAIAAWVGGTVETTRDATDEYQSCITIPRPEGSPQVAHDGWWVIRNEAGGRHIMSPTCVSAEVVADLRMRMGGSEDPVVATIRSAFDDWKTQSDPFDHRGVSMPEYIRRALADAGLLAAQADADRQRIAIAMHLKPTAGVDSIVHWAENHVDSIRNLALDRDKVREELLPLLRQHPLSKDDVEGDNLRAGFIAKVAADVLRWYVYEMQRWEATFGKDALPHATAIIEERDALRAQLAAAVVLPSDWYDQLAVAESGHRAAAVIAQWRQQPAASADTSPLSHALLLKGYRGFADQVDAMARKIQEQEQQLALALETLGSIWLYVKWRYVTGKLTTEQRELWADAVDAFGDPEDRGPKAERWWRDDFVEGNGA